MYNTWRDIWVSEYQERGFFQMLSGFYCRGVMTRNEATNYPIQGSAFHCLLWSFIELDRIFHERGMKTRLCGEIHDEMMGMIWPSEREQAADLYRKVMCKNLPEAWKWLVVPLDIEGYLTEVDGVWSEKKDWKR